MKHKILLLTALLALSNSVFALPDYDDLDHNKPDPTANKKLQELSSYYDFSPTGVQVFITPEWILFDGEELKLPPSEFRLEKDGYYYVKDNIVIFDQFHHLLSWRNTTLDFHPLYDEKIPYGAKAIYKPSSFFSESLKGNQIDYNANDLNDILRKPYTKRHHSYFGGSKGIEENEKFFIWNEEHKPWVTQKIGESVTAEFKDEVNAVSLLNGYVDPFHPDLYKKNARVKDIKITDENGAEYFFTLLDEVKVQTFMLSNCAKKLTLTVLSTYKGKKYDDIALSLFSGVYADTYLDWIVFRELEAAKEKTELAYIGYESVKKYRSQDIPQDLSLISQDWEMYCMSVEDRIGKEFDGKSAEHDVEIYSSPDFKVHLKAEHGYCWLSLYTKEKIKTLSYQFKNFYSCTGKMIAEKNVDVASSFAAETTEKDGWIVSRVHFWGSGELALPISAWIQVKLESGKKKEVVMSKDGLQKVQRFGELLLGAFDFK